MIERQLHLCGGILGDAAGVDVATEESGEIQAILRDDARGEQRICRVSWRRHGLLPRKIARGYHSHLYRCVREPGYIDRRAGGWGFREVLFPDALQRTFVGRV